MSKTVSPGYSTKAIVFCSCSSVAIRLSPLSSLPRCTNGSTLRRESAEQSLEQVWPTCEGSFQIRAVFGQPGRAAVLLEAPERRIRIVLHSGLYALGLLLALQPGHQVQRHIDPPRHARSRDEVAVLNPITLDVVGPQLL